MSVALHADSNAGAWLLDHHRVWNKAMLDMAHGYGQSTSVNGGKQLLHSRVRPKFRRRTGTATLWMTGDGCGLHFKF
jgi:hypothetical protein